MVYTHLVLGLALLVAGSWLGAGAARGLAPSGPDRAAWARRLHWTGPWTGGGWGLVLAGLLQSSSVAVVLVAVLADGGLLPVAAAFGAVAGANVGGTLLPHLLRWHLDGRLLAVGASGAALLLLVPRTRRFGQLAAAVVLWLGGLEQLEGVFGPALRAVVVLPTQGRVTTVAWGYGAGLVSTVAAFSSGLTIALAQRAVEQGAVGLRAGLAFVLGANVGTTADVLVASGGMGRLGRRVALFHLGFNLWTSLWGFPLLLAAGEGELRVAAWTGLGGAHTLVDGASALWVLVGLAVFGYWRRWHRVPAGRGIVHPGPMPDNTGGYAPDSWLGRGRTIGGSPRRNQWFWQYWEAFFSARPRSK